MPCIKDNNTVKAIARAYCSNGHCKVKALLAAGYKERYANTVGLKLYDNIRLKEAIAKIEAESAAKTGYTVEQCLLEYEQARIHAHAQRSASAEVSAITGKARLFGFDKDSRLDQPGAQALSEAEAADRKAFTEWQLRQGLKVKREA